MLAFKYNLNLLNSVEKMDFDVSHMPISEFLLIYWKQIFFFHSAIEQGNFSTPPPTKLLDASIYLIS